MLFLRSKRKCYDNHITLFLWNEIPAAICKTPVKFAGLIFFSHQLLQKTTKTKGENLKRGYARIAIIG